MAEGAKRSVYWARAKILLQVCWPIAEIDPGLFEYSRHYGLASCQLPGHHVFNDVTQALLLEDVLRHEVSKYRLCQRTLAHVVVFAKSDYARSFGKVLDSQWIRLLRRSCTHQCGPASACILEAFR